ALLAARRGGHQPDGLSRIRRRQPVPPLPTGPAVEYHQPQGARAVPVRAAAIPATRARRRVHAASRVHSGCPERLLAALAVVRGAPRAWMAEHPEDPAA